MKSLALLCSALLLAACGGGGGHNADTSPTTPPPPPVMTDAFTATVLALIATSPDDAEPTDTSNVALTTSEDKEPEPVDKVAAP
ncbi:hypothetical protein [Pseudoduganella sp. RAF53_2]|uniref:hypothetical protein n=1 Tax=unclassified Pseudoduganella TaxID=2637179 RepID=UPI003F9E3055